MGRAGLIRACQKAYLGSSLCEHQDVAVLEIGFGNLPAVEKGPVGAAIHDFEAVAVPDNAGMFSGNEGLVLGKLDVRRRVATEGDFRFGKFLDVTFHGSFDMHELDNDERCAFHLATPKKRISH